MRLVKQPRYKVIETMIVTDQELERISNEMVADGWLLDGIRFAMSEASRRPAMAFLFFTRDGELAHGS